MLSLLHIDEGSAEKPSCQAVFLLVNSMHDEVARGDTAYRQQQSGLVLEGMSLHFFWLTSLLGEDP